jgi:GDPmannose 4,6-dehydratase/GDP-4-dehydro-6-deoxy-D-mannose reductase
VGFINPLAVLQNNIMGTANLFEGIALSGIDPIIQVCSTSEVYGQVDPKNVPITEDCPLQPSSPYAVSKMAQDSLGLSYFRSHKMKVIRTRMFAYLNPRRTDLFATSFAMQIARIEAGLKKELLHGNLDSVRTLIDVRDAMAAYWEAAVKGVPGEIYNIGGTTTTTVGEFLQLLKGLATTEIPSRQDPKLLRPADVTLQIPNVERFFRTTGWKPKYTFKESVAFLLDHCRNAVAREVS